MRRLARHMFTLGSAASLVLCVAACVLCVRSYWVADVWTRSTMDVRAGIATGCQWRAHFVAGVLAFNRTGDRYRLPTEALSSRGEVAATAPSPDYSTSQHQWLRMDVDVVTITKRWWYQRLGFDAFSFPRRGAWGRHTWGVLVPHWLPAVLLAVLPLAWIGVHRRRVRRATRGLCSRCGYDLRASPGRCPECGSEKAS
jgi:hypothetical protein